VFWVGAGRCGPRSVRDPTSCQSKLLFIEPRHGAGRNFPFSSLTIRAPVAVGLSPPWSSLLRERSEPKRSSVRTKENSPGQSDATPWAPDAELIALLFLFRVLAMAARKSGIGKRAAGGFGGPCRGRRRRLRCTATGLALGQIVPPRPGLSKGASRASPRRVAAASAFNELWSDTAAPWLWTVLIAAKKVLRLERNRERYIKDCSCISM